MCLAEAWEEVSPGEESFSLFRCLACGCFRVGQEMIAEGDRYQRYYADGSAQRVSGLFDLLWRGFRRQKARRILKRSPAGARICDIGCERGELLHLLKENGCRVYGTQLSRTAARFARERYGIEVFVGELTAAPFAQGGFDAALMINVLEHLPEPERYLRQVHRILRPGGSFWCEVPNGDSWTARWTGKRWLHHDPEHHLWTFGRDNLYRFLRRCGFVVEEAFHVSWEHGPFGCVQSWLNGLPGPRDRLFGFVRNGWTGTWKERFMTGLHLLFLAGLGLPACLVSLMEGLLGNGQVVLVRARKA